MMRLATLAVTVLAAPAAAAEVVTLAGARVPGTLAAVTAQGVTVKDAAGVAVTTPAADIAAVELNPPAAPTGKSDEVELVDGSVLRATKFGVKGTAVELALLAPGVAVELPLGAVFTLTRGADDPAAREAFAQLVAGRGKRDLFVVKQAAGLNPLPGTVLGGTAAGDAVEFEREDGQRVTLRLSRASGGIVFNPPPRDVVPPAVCRVVDRAGNRLVARAVTVTGKGLDVTTVAGAVVRYAALDAVEKLDFKQGNVRYLADLDGIADLAPDADALAGPPLTLAVVGRDKAVGGGPITLDGKAFARGVSLPADAVVTYPLGGQFREFRATVGVQDGPGRAGWAMRLRVELDGRAVFDEVVKKPDPPRELAVTVKGAKELKLVVERSGSVVDGDQVNLADARVLK